MRTRYRYELVNRDTGEVVAVYKTRAEANGHVARFPGDYIRRVETGTRVS